MFKPHYQLLNNCLLLNNNCVNISSLGRGHQIITVYCCSVEVDSVRAISRIELPS